MATDQSNLQFDNPLDVLAAVASETLRYEIHQPEVPEVSVPNVIKRQNKKSAMSYLTFENIKCMSGKTLIDKFSEMKSDEYTKKYSYKCLLLPESCSKTFKSFGNEKKAYDAIKVHLLKHVDSLTEEYQLNGYTLNVAFVPKSPTSTSKYGEKQAKKSQKKSHAPQNGMLHRTNSSKKSKKSPLKTGKRKFQENKTYDSETKNNYVRVKLKRNLVKYRKENSSVKFSNDDYILDQMIFRRELSEVFDSENYSSYNQYLDFTIYNDAEVNEASSSSEQEMNDSNGFDVEKTTDLSKLNAPSMEKWVPFLQDHCYASLEGSKTDEPLLSDCKPRRYQNPFFHLKSKRYSLRTPAFPYVHSPLWPEVSNMVELRGFYNSDSPLYEKCEVHYCLDSNAPQGQEEPDENSSDFEGKCSELFTKGSTTSNSVLECVENIENKKHSSSSVPKSGISARENDENLEHRQKTERELALKYIAKMHSKGKKKLTDSLHCKICPDKSFTAQATLLHHYRSHAGIKPYSCKLCTKTFTRQHSLNYHMLIHQNLSRFTCKVCGRTFRHPSHFKEHSRRHTGETPFHCIDCNLHFKTRNTFKRHLKTRHGKLLTAGGIEDLNSE